VDLLVRDVAIIHPHFIEELEMDFAKKKVKKFFMSTKSDKATGIDGVPANAWKVLST
jgi:hypothetical protein